MRKGSVLVRLVESLAPPRQFGLDSDHMPRARTANNVRAASLIVKLATVSAAIPGITIAED